VSKICDERSRICDCCDGITYGLGDGFSDRLRCSAGVNHQRLLSR
jgi:hypothetical protein